MGAALGDVKVPRFSVEEQQKVELTSLDRSSSTPVASLCDSRVGPESGVKCYSRRGIYHDQQKGICRDRGAKWER